ncbi:MAG: cupredoxin domain-containing protein, partial [Streptococcaceae bacterium]|nr:cupredoxin domain-containing protein [Streptococcaceae bacterium]
MITKITVLILGLAAIGFILWWFFGPHETAAGEATLLDGEQQVAVSVDGGYQPSVINLKAGIPSVLTFNRKDPSSCLDHVVFSDFGINAALPEHADVPINLAALTPGEYNFACGMNMFHGK